VSRQSSVLSFQFSVKRQVGCYSGVFGTIVAGVNGGKHGARHRVATFAPQKTAAKPRRATVLAQTRRQQGKMALLLRNWHCPARTGETAAAQDKIIFTTEAQRTQRKDKGKDSMQRREVAKTQRDTVKKRNTKSPSHKDTR